MPMCLCGFYARYDFLDLDLSLKGSTSKQGKAPDNDIGVEHRLSALVADKVCGSIKATGHVLMGEAGFKAEFAEIEALCGVQAKLPATYYRVPWFATWEELIAEFPPSDLSNLLPAQQAQEATDE